MYAVGSSVLIVEENLDVRHLLAEALTNEGGFLVRTAGTISEAQVLMTECGESFAVAVLDISLRYDESFSFCASLRRQGFRLPVILLSGAHSGDDVVRGFKAGADDYLLKPFGIAELLACIAAQLRQVGSKSAASN